MVLRSIVPESPLLQLLLALTAFVSQVTTNGAALVAGIATKEADTIAKALSNGFSENCLVSVVVVSVSTPVVPDFVEVRPADLANSDATTICPSLRLNTIL